MLSAEQIYYSSVKNEYHNYEAFEAFEYAIEEFSNFYACGNFLIEDESLTYRIHFLTKDREVGSVWYKDKPVMIIDKYSDGIISSEYVTNIKLYKEMVLYIFKMYLKKVNQVTEYSRKDGLINDDDLLTDNEVITENDFSFNN